MMDKKLLLSSPIIQSLLAWCISCIELMLVAVEPEERCGGCQGSGEGNEQNKSNWQLGLWHSSRCPSGT